MADPSKTEQPTQKRKLDARKKGQFPQARLFVGGVQFVAFVALMRHFAPAWLEDTRLVSRHIIERAFGPELRIEEVTRMAIELSWRALLPLLIGGALLVLLTLAAQLAVTRFGFTPQKLVPDFKRLNPVNRLKELPRQNIPSLMQALILLPLFGGAVWVVGRESLEKNFGLPLQPVHAGLQQVAILLGELLWKAAAVFFVLGCVDLYRQTRRHQKDLRMSKHEIKEEAKQTDGDPHIKARIRRLQRDNLRRRMMAQVPKASAVVVNPTHYAVALRYEPETMTAPLVVAKGKNYMALRIRKVALEHQVPLIENPPLARALHGSVEVGQEIPPHLYRAVAEVLAYLFRLMHGKAPGVR